MTDSILDAIIRIKRDEIAALIPQRAELEAQARAQVPPRPFLADVKAAITSDGQAFICEFKRRSPSAGNISDNSDPATMARLYRSGGACAMSVLTDREFFGGTPDDLRTVREAVSLPALRKDFTLDPIQVTQARAIGADAILVIMAILSDSEASAICDAAHELGMAALIETHDVAEMERALALPSPLIGVNNRDLRTMVTDLSVGERLCALVPDDRIAVAESGLSTPADINRMQTAGARAFLIGHSLMATDDPCGKLQSLRRGR